MKIIYLLLFTLITLEIHGQNFPFRYFEPFTPSTSEEINCMFFDKEGLMWIGTNAGVKSYDGYMTKTYKSDAFSPGILPNNNIRSIVEDHNDCLWLGTNNGLVRMNKRTGTFSTFLLPLDNQRIIYTLYLSKDGTLWVGTDGGLSVFDTKKETFYTYNKSNSWMIHSNGEKSKLTFYSVKSILEDDNGDLLIGTWSTGLLRLKRGSHVFQQYPKLNDSNSAYSLFFDKYHRLWVGTWGYGIIRIDNPSNVKYPIMQQYSYKTSDFDTYYKIIEDPITQTLWACTREGVCYMDENKPDAEWQKYHQIGNNSLALNNSIATDQHGNIWLCTQNHGIMQVNTNLSPFKLWNLEKQQPTWQINYICSLFTHDGKWFWLGLNPYGIALYNRETGATYYNKEISGFENIKDMALTTSISCITQRNNGELWFANNSYGIIIKKPSSPAILLDKNNVSYISDNFVNTLFESKDKTMWIGQRNGLSVVYPDNTGTILKLQDGKYDFSDCDVRHISQDRHGNIWLATDNVGIIRISNDPHKPKSLKFKQYNPKYGNFAIDDAIACLEDRKGRLWAISNSGGLFLYNKEKDCFDPKNREFHIMGERVLAINEDDYGSLWLTTDKSLIQLIWGGKASTPEEARYFDQKDGLGDILFSANSTFKFGKELFFGGRTRFFSFTPSPNMLQGFTTKSNLVIRDILIDDMSFLQLDSISRTAISSEMPAYTRKISIPSKNKKISIDFALLTYGNAKKILYAYKLEGYDKDWQYCGSDIHRATFQNLPSGTYQLHIKANDSYGHWLELPYTLRIKVLPPWYASRWAYMIYIILFILGVFAITHWYKQHLKTKNRLQMGIILTNITHELLTPLTVISATIYKLKKQAPQFESDYEVMDNNINRTTQLLRQILEVRKSQAGQLKLRVSKGDLSTFLMQACENIRPMAAKQGITLLTEMPKNELQAWFDTDKLDKILYNLLSNAVKYNKKDGNITVTMSNEPDFVTIKISDTGIGMSTEQQKNLYIRFFDGDYRKQKMQGTGIGLSLTHDLIKLHHGKIECLSKEGEGTSFTIILPTHKKSYAPTEIEKTIPNKEETYQAIKEANSEHPSISIPTTASILPKSKRYRENAQTILVVEDNTEVLELIVDMLDKKYNIITAKNGKQALNIIHKEELDLVVSDIMMPIMDGIELTHQIKNDEQYWQLPIILLSAKNSEEDKTEGYANGADAYITKPFKFEDLEIRIQTLLANRKKIKEKFSQETLANKEGESNHYSNPDLEFINKVRKLIMQNLTESEYNRESIAKDMAISSTTLYNKVKAITGMTLIAFINKLRMEEAKRIIDTEADISMSEVAFRAGFNTPKYFSKCFKSTYGVFPKEYAKKLKEEITQQKKN